jgi:hypothetical protein
MMFGRSDNGSNTQTLYFCLCRCGSARSRRCAFTSTAAAGNVHTQGIRAAEFRPAVFQ